jgi:hypothetical protein
LKGGLICCMAHNMSSDFTFERPKPSMEIASPNGPSSRTGRRP